MKKTEKAKSEITFIPSGRGKAQCAPDPKYPDGVEIDPFPDQPGEWFDIPYPAPECGVFLIRHPAWGNIMITAAGQPDDPRRIRIPFIL